MKLDAHKVVAGRSLPVNIRCVSKSGLPMHVRITGMADGPVTCQIARTAVVADACMLSGQYTAELLPESDVLQPDVRKWQLSLKPLEKRSFAFPHTILRNGWWDVRASATASLSSGETLPFDAPLRCLAKGWHGRYAGENDTDWFMVCGRFSYHLSKDGGSGVVRTFGHDESVTLFRCPSLGLPYSNEFSTIRAEHVEARQEDDGSMLQLADFMSSDFPGVMVRAAGY